MLAVTGERTNIGILTTFRVSENTYSVMKGAQFIQSEQDTCTRHTLRETKTSQEKQDLSPQKWDERW